MTTSLLDDLVKLHDIQTKRKHLQRKIVFSEPVMSMSLKRISENETLARSESTTDDSDLISDLRKLDNKHIKKFHKSGYNRITDIKNTDSRQISSEVDLPWEAIREVQQMVDGNVGFSFDPVDEDVEKIDKSDAVESLISNAYWLSLILFEHSLRSSCAEKARDILDNQDRKNRKNLIKGSYNSKRRAKSHTRKLANFAQCSEQYVKNVITGRIDEGLSESERDSILDRDDNQCRKCESTDELEVHHIIPVSDGGTKDESNLCTLCSDCHLNIAHGGNTAQVTYSTKDEFWSIVD